MRKPKIETLMRRVQKTYADAAAKQDKFGDWFISNDKTNLMVHHMIPHTETEYEAWHQMWECNRTSQNIRRSSPLKAIFYRTDEEKAGRISDRIRGNKNKSTRKKKTPSA